MYQPKATLRTIYSLTHLEQSLLGYRTELVRQQVKAKKRLATNTPPLMPSDIKCLHNTILHRKIHIQNYTQIIRFLTMTRDQLQGN